MELYPGYLEDHFNIHKLSGTGGASPPEYMTSAAAAQYAPAPLRMAMYERAPPQQHQQQQQPQLQPALGMWSSEPYKVDSGGQATSGSSIMEPDAKFDHAGLDEDPQMDELETAGDADQGASKPKEKGHEKTCTEQRGCPEKSPPKKGLHPAAGVEPDKAGAAGAGAAAHQAAARGVRGEQPGDEPAASSRRGLGRPLRVRGRGADDGPRRGGVRDRLRALGGRAEAAHGGAAERATAGAGHVGAGAGGDGADRARQLRQPLPDQGRRRAGRRLLRHVGALAVPRRALLPLDRRLPALRGPQDLEPAAGADDGPAVGGGVRAAADVGAGGGRAVAGHAEAAADAGRVPHGPLRRPRRLHGRRRREAQGPRRLRAAGGPSPAGDAAEHAQDPDDAAGGQGPARAGGLLPAPSRAQHALGGPPARVRHKLNCARSRSNGGSRERSMMAQKKLVRTYVVIHPSAGQRRTKRSISLGPREKR
uniref:Uncharacterized protein n=2 Tax=Aegilops tauschii subsp. strangulata TaxID=200361 RepID=A0A453DAA0_AEGTS